MSNLRWERGSIGITTASFITLIPHIALRTLCYVVEDSVCQARVEEDLGGRLGMG
jgi:hypothetical protein